jgi:hypothetical protein
MFRWTPPVALVVLVVAAPWPFGSVIPRAASILTACLLGLSGLYAADRLVRNKSLTLPAALPWIAAGFLLVVLQQVPLPPTAIGAAAPGAADVYRSLQRELEIAGWHPVSVESFQTLWACLQLCGLLGAFWLSSRLYRRSSERNLLACSLVLVGLALTLFAVYQKARFGTLLYGSVPVESATPFGPFVNHNHFAGFVEACVLIALGTALGMIRRHGALALLFAGAAVIMGIGHLLSHSRGGLVALGLGLATLAWLARGHEEHGRRFLLLGGGFAVVSFVLVFAPSSLYQRIATLGNPVADESVQFRVQLWRDSVRLWAASPILGTGLGTYAAAVPAYRSGPDETRAEYAESDWVQLLCEGGAASVLIVILFLGAISRGAYREIVEDRSDQSRGVKQGAFAAVVALVAHGFVDFNFRIPSNALLFAVLLGVVAPAGRKLTWEGRRLWHWAGAAVAAVLAVVLSLHTLRLGASEDLNRQVNPLMAAPDEFPDLIQRLASSRELVPENPETSFLLGRLYNEEAYRSREEVRYRELRLDQARSAFRSALLRAPARGRTWFELAWTEANLKNDERADRLFAHALTLEPHWSNLRANYALYLVSRGRIDEALDQVEAGRELEPGLAPLDALNVIGPYLGDDPVSLRRAAGDDEEGASALASFRKSNVE